MPLLFFPIVFCSCKSTFEAQFLSPPELDNGIQARKIVIVNQEGNQPSMDAIEAFYQCAKEIPDYDFQIVDDLLDGSSDSARLVSASGICEKYKADAVLSMEQFTADVTIKKSNLNQTQYSLLQEWEATLLLSYSVKWTMLSPNSDEQLNGFSNAYSNVFTARGDDEFSAEANLPDYRDILSNAAKTEGQYYAQRTLPSWEPAIRQYYRATGFNMRKAAKFARKGHWKEAANCWKKEYQSKTEKNQAKCAYNLALACEMEGNIKEAIRWVQIAYFENDFQPAGDYILALRKRAMNHYNVVEHYSQLSQPTP